MKNTIVFLFFCFLLIGCTTLSDIPSYTETVVLDFSKYSNEGFLITPESYQKDYTSIGIIDISLYPRAKKVSAITPELKKLYNVQGLWLVEKITAKEVIDIIYNESKAMGADAVINFKIEPISKTYNYEFIHTGLRVSGFAIKRK